MGVRLTGGMVSITAVGAGNGVALGLATANPTAWTLSTGKRAVIKKIMWRCGIAGGANLLVGYGDRTVAGSIFRQVLPNIRMVTGVDGELNEEDLPIAGNSPEGFVADTTAVTGSVGSIFVETDGAAGAYPGDVQVILEVEEE